jgi:hypothetical protein
MQSLELSPNAMTFTNLLKTVDERSVSDKLNESSSTYPFSHGTIWLSTRHCYLGVGKEIANQR